MTTLSIGDFTCDTTLSVSDSICDSTLPIVDSIHVITLPVGDAIHDTILNYRTEARYLPLLKHSRQITSKYRTLCNATTEFTFNPLNPELNPICYLLALLGAHHFLHVSRIRVKLLNFRLLMFYIYIYMEHPFLMFLDHTQRRSTVGRTPLDE